MSSLLKFHDDDDDIEEEDEELTLETSWKLPVPGFEALSKSDVTPSAFLPSLILAANDNEEEEEEDEEISAFEIAALTSGNMSFLAKSIEGSTDFVDAEQSITNDPWDQKSWIIYIREAQNDRGGTVTVFDAYERYANQFPTSSRVAEQYASLYATRGNFTSALNTFKKSLTKCSSVTLWKAYLFLLRQLVLDKTKRVGEDLGRDHMVNEFERALDW